MSGRKLPIAYLFGKDLTLTEQTKEGVKHDLESKLARPIASANEPCFKSTIYISQYLPSVLPKLTSFPVTHTFDSSSPSNVRRLQNLLDDPSEPKPDYIFTGLGFTKEEFATHHDVKGGENVTWIYGNPSSWVKPAGRSGPPLQDEVVERIRKGLKYYEKLEDDGKGKVWTWWWTGENGIEEYKM